MIVHANDSKGQLGSGKDRHDHIGEGSIGLAGFAPSLRVRSFEGSHSCSKRLLMLLRTRFGT